MSCYRLCSVYACILNCRNWLWQNGMCLVSVLVGILLNNNIQSHRKASKSVKSLFQLSVVFMFVPLFNC